MILFIFFLISDSKTVTEPFLDEFDRRMDSRFEGLLPEGINKKKYQNYLNSLTDNTWGFVPDSKTLTGSSQVSTYVDPYVYWDPHYNYTDYWNYSYPITVYPRKAAVDYGSFGHSLYSNLFTG